MNFTQLLDIVQTVKTGNIKFYLVLRNVKAGLNKKTPSTNKYDYGAYQIEIDKEIRENFHDLTKEVIGGLIAKEVELHEYDPIADDTQQAFTYSIQDSSHSFSDVISKQLMGHVPKVKDLNDLLKKGELWAYCTGFSLDHEKVLYTFTKYSVGKVAVEMEDNPEKSKLSRLFQTRFNTETSKLELIHGQTMSLTRSIDCIYFQEVFYGIRKTSFEHIIGMEEEFKATSIMYVDELEATNKFEGLEVLKVQVEQRPALHRKLTRLARLKNHTNINADTIKNMQIAASLEGKNVTLSREGKLVITNEEDIELLVKLLAEYYKTGLVFGKTYGTYAGKIMEK